MLLEYHSKTNPNYTDDSFGYIHDLSQCRSAEANLGICPKDFKIGHKDPNTARSCKYTRVAM